MFECLCQTKAMIRFACSGLAIDLEQAILFANLDTSFTK